MTYNNNIQELFEESLNHIMVKPGSIINASVMSIKDSIVVLDANLKSEAFIPISQFDGEVEIGATVRVYLISLDNGHGQLIVSREKAKTIEVLESMDKAMSDSTSVIGKVVKQVRGGYTVMLKGLRAFLPGSLVGTQSVDDELVDQTLEFKVLRVDHIRGNVVLSRKAALEEHNQEERKKLLDTIKIGDIFPGVIKNLTDFGAFVDIGCFDGLVHIADISWKRIKHPSDILQIGQKIDVKVLNFENNKLALGIKQINNDPWLTITEDIKVGSIVKGKVTNITDYGCFISIKDGIEGLVHSTEIDWQYRSVNPAKYCNVGDIVDVRVMDINVEKHRIALSIKDCKENPWVEFANKTKKHDIIRGKIVSVTEFGLFVHLANNIDGLVHISDVAHHNPEAELLKYKTGEEIDVCVISIDTKRQRITLGIKQIQVDEFTRFVATTTVGEKVSCVVTDISDKNNLKVEIQPDVIGIISHDNIFKGSKGEFEVGDKISANILQIDRKKRLVYLSMLTEAKKESRDKQEVIKSTLGDLISRKLKEQEEE